MVKSILIYLLGTGLFWLVSGCPAYADTVCFECHDKTQFAGKIVHSPVKELRCGTCHNPHVARYQGLLNMREDKLCFTCHLDLKKNYNQGVVHDPVAKGSCSICHAPHVSESNGLVRENLADICFNCHAKLPREYPHVHEPFAKGQCIVCHKPHNADNLELLTDAPDNLCQSCHKQADLNQSHQNYTGKLKGCLSCHSPHGSERVALVRNNLHEPYEKGCSACHTSPDGLTMETCLKCHEDVREQMLKTRNHMTLHNGNSCLNCHSPHAGDTTLLLKSRERIFCTSCHEKTLDGYVASDFKHPDINNCSDCHESHGSQHKSMLKGDGNDVCSNKCHKVQGTFTHPVGPKILDPSTGQMVTCVSCHNPMGTEYEYHLVKDGKYALCIQCHRSY